MLSMQLISGLSRIRNTYMEISEKEFAVMKEIYNNHLPDQRTISQRTGISLGLTNLIIKRLIGKGILLARQLNKKKIQYILTSKGFSEKAKKSYNFTIKTIGLLKSTKEIINRLILEELKKGNQSFVITGSSDLCDIVEIVLNNFKDRVICRRENNQGPNHNSAYLIITDGKGTRNSIDLIDYLAKTGLLYW